jgi:recombinational DNA repair protein (RecF pathway)
MGDRYFLTLKCAKCGKRDDDVYYAPTCGFEGFVCQGCGAVNKIHSNFSCSVNPPTPKGLGEEEEGP